MSASSIVSVIGLIATAAMAEKPGQAVVGWYKTAILCNFWCTSNIEAKWNCITYFLTVCIPKR